MEEIAEWSGENLVWYVRQVAIVMIDGHVDAVFKTLSNAIEHRQLRLREGRQAEIVLRILHK
jgi:hypothetical protein